jgi:putative transposase
LTDAQCGVLSIFVVPAKRHDSLLLQDVLEQVVVASPVPRVHPQHLCLDKAFDGETGQAAAMVFGYLPHIRRIGEQKLDGEGQTTHPVRRWVVERSFVWLNNCRAILVRWAKKSSNYLGLIKLTWICGSTAGSNA